MANIPILIATDTIGSGPTRTSRPKHPQRKGLWYWLVVAPVKWTMIAMGVMVAMVFLISFGIIFAIPWIIVRTVQKKPLVPTFSNK